MRQSWSYSELKYFMPKKAVLAKSLAEKDAAYEKQKNLRFAH